MASSQKAACVFFFLFTTLVFSLQIHASDSQFFNKQTPKITPQESPLKKNEVEEEEPSFLPQTSGTGYGLYGHETGLDPPTTDDNNNRNNNEDNEAISHHDQKNYVTELKGLSVNDFSDDDIPTKSNNYYNKYNNGGERKYNYNNYYYGGVGYNGGVDKQGISDASGLDDGKHTYDIDSEKKRFDQYDHRYQSNYKSYPDNYNNNYYHKDGYFGHFANGNKNYGEFYNSGNAMHQGYQNQMQGEDEFDLDP